MRKPRSTSPFALPHNDGPSDGDVLGDLFLRTTLVAKECARPLNISAWSWRIHRGSTIDHGGNDRRNSSIVSPSEPRAGEREVAPADEIR
jgi:hypothetical protein